MPKATTQKWEGMTDLEISVYFDYVCPFCLLAEDIITEVAAENGLAVNWKAFELRPYPQPTLRPEDNYLPDIWERSVYPLARELNVAITLPTVSPQPYSHTAFEGMIHARSHGRQDEYNNRVFRAFFQEDKDIGDVDVLCSLAADAGLDAEDFRRAILDGRHAEEHRSALDDARAAEITSVPTIMVGDYRLAGVPRKWQLAEFVARASGASTRSAP